MDHLCGAGSSLTVGKNQAYENYLATVELSKEPLKEEDLLLERFYKHVSERGSDVYLTQPVTGQETPSTYTWQQVHSEASKMAAHINSMGFEKHSKIAIASKNCAHFIIAELAIWMSGNTTVALFPNLNEGTCKYILDHCEAKLLFVGKIEPSWDKMKKGVPEDLPTIGLGPLAPSEYESWESITQKTEPLSDKVTRDFDDEALIVYTSGSTGQPKGVLHSFRTISMPTKLLSFCHSYNPQDRYLSYLPIAHVMDRWIGLCCSLYAGYQVFFAESINTFVQDLQRCRPTIFISVPRLWLKFQLGVFKKLPEKKLNFLLKIPIISGLIRKKIVSGLGLECARLTGSGSAPIPGELLDWYRTLGLNMLEGYGMSENFCYSHMAIEGRTKVGTIGSPYPGAEHKISEEGEILVKSPGTMVGYYKAPEKTKEVITEDGYLRTGDKGTIDDENRLSITGRIKELFKTSKGKYVAPGPIENIINNNSNIELSLVGGSGQVNCMTIIQLAEGLLEKCNSDDKVKSRVTLELTELLGEVNSKIEEYEKVGFFVIAKEPWTIEKEFLTPTMKIKRSKIEESYESKVEGWYSAGQKLIWEE